MLPDVNNLYRFKPAVSRSWLLALAGFSWSAVGVLLCLKAYHWLQSLNGSGAAALAIFGMLLAIIAFHLGFSRIAKKNIERLALMEEKPCIFAFQAWKSYLIVGLMIALGIVLRRLPIPRYYLSVAYTTIGGALVLSSFHYYIYLWRDVLQKKL